jgi:hypothetical protein
LPSCAGWCFAVPTFVLRVPWSFLESTLWTMLVRAGQSHPLLLLQLNGQG